MPKMRSDASAVIVPFRYRVGRRNVPGVNPTLNSEPVARAHIKAGRSRYAYITVCSVEIEGLTSFSRSEDQPVVQGAHTATDPINRVPFGRPPTDQSRGRRNAA